MAKKNDGTLAQDEFKRHHYEAIRLYDYRSSIGIIPVQPGDFVIPNAIVECKSTIKSTFKKGVFKKEQLALQRQYASVGVPTVYYLRFVGGKSDSRYVGFHVIWEFFYTKGKGALTKEDIVKFGFKDIREAVQDEKDYCNS